MSGFSASIQNRNNAPVRPVQQANIDNKISVKRHRVKQKLESVDQVKRSKIF